MFSKPKVAIFGNYAFDAAPINTQSFNVLNNLSSGGKDLTRDFRTYQGSSQTNVMYFLTDKSESTRIVTFH